LKMKIEKNRYGEPNQEEELFAPFAINYVGNWNVSVQLGGVDAQSPLQSTGLLPRTTG
jgi:hypothetical protein